MHNILHKKYYNIENSEQYLVHLWSQTKSSGIKLPEFHGVSKNLDPNIQPEKQNIRPLKGNEISQGMPRIGKRKAEIRRRRLPHIYQTIAQPAETSKKIPEASNIEKKVINQTDFTATMQSINNSNAEAINRRSMIKDIPFYPDPTYRAPPKPVRIPTSESSENIDISLIINIDFEENSPFQGVISKPFQRPDKSFFQEPQEYEGHVIPAR